MKKLWTLDIMVSKKNSIMFTTQRTTRLKKHLEVNHSLAIWEEIWLWRHHVIEILVSKSAKQQIYATECSQFMLPYYEHYRKPLQVENIRSSLDCLQTKFYGVYNKRFWKSKEGHSADMKITKMKGHRRTLACTKLPDITNFN